MALSAACKHQLCVARVSDATATSCHLSLKICHVSLLARAGRREARFNKTFSEMLGRNVTLNSIFLLVSSKLLNENVHI